VLVPLLMVFAAGFVFLVVEVVVEVARPIDATNEYLADVKAGRYREAYGRTCRYRPSFEQFVAALQRADDRLGPLVAYDITGVDDTERGTFTKGTWTRGGHKNRVAFEVREEGGEWKVCGTPSV